MIEYNILNPSFFINTMKSISSVVDEGYLEFGDGIRVFGIGPSRIILFELTIGDDILDIIQGGQEDVPLNLDDLRKVLERFKGGKPEYLTLSYDNTQLKLKVKGKINNKTKTFTLSAIDLDYKTDINPLPKLMKLHLDAIFKIGVSDMVDALKDINLVSEFFNIETLNNSVLFTGGAALGTAETEIESKSEIYSNQKCSYSLLLVKKILESTYNNEVVIMFKKDYPIAIYDKISDKSKMVWFLGPRVETDD